MPVNMKKVIVGSLVELSKKKDIDKITVKDLVEECHISRQSFYYHFRDILDVVEWSVEQEIEEALTECLKEETPEAAFAIFISMFRKNDDILLKALHSQKREFVETVLLKGVRTYLQKALQIKSPDVMVSLADGEMALQFYSYGIVGVLMEHCGDRQLDVEKLARQICRFMKIEELE